MNPKRSSAFPAGQAIYQIYPRSFSDSNNDGIGDLPGIISRLDYLANLGITTIWLCPFYPSPQVDFGYDVADYQAVDPTYGTLADFDLLVAEARKRHIGIIIDFVGNHTSDQHPWFKEAAASKDNPKRDWYIWRDAGPDETVPNNWISAFGGSAWEFSPTTNQYYLHSFAKQQPDLNWRNPEVRAAMKAVLRFWLGRGIAGFRMDAVSWYAKDPLYRNDPPNADYIPKNPDSQDYDSLSHIHSQGQPEVFDYLNELCGVLEPYGDRFMVIEAHFDMLYDVQSYFDFYKRLNTRVAAPFNFIDLFLPWSAERFRSFLDTFQAGLRPEDTPVYVTGNHDRPRLASRIGQDAVKASAVLFLMLPGTSVIYYGEEIGMENAEIPDDAIQDVVERTSAGQRWGRDPARSPMQWAMGLHAGFSTAHPWLPVGANYLTNNVESEALDPHSFLNLYRQLLKLRAGSAAITHGTYRPLHLHNANLLGFVRKHRDEKITVVVNFSRTEQQPCKIQGQLLLSTHDAQTADEPLQPLEGRVIRQLPV